MHRFLRWVSPAVFLAALTAGCGKKDDKVAAPETFAPPPKSRPLAGDAPVQPGKKSQPGDTAPSAEP